MKKLFQPATIITFTMIFLASSLGQSCELVMGYQKKAKSPLINKAPDNTGLYLEIYAQAAQEINCDLNVVRLPKRRVLQDMKQGWIDFYPGMKFTDGRSIYVHFIPNGLTTGRVGLSRVNMPLITNKKNLAGHSVLIALGGINYVSDIHGIKVHQVLNLDIEKAAKMLILERGDFFATDPFVVDSFLKNTQDPTFKKHPNCCGGIKPMHIGFSKKSKYIKEKNNPNYNADLPLSIHNNPTLIEKDSTAYKFGEAVRRLAQGYQYK